jgi:hypothetical protein
MTPVIATLAALAALVFSLPVRVGEAQSRISSTFAVLATGFMNDPG